MTVTEDTREWDYGEYEGITSKEIQERRKVGGLGPWDIWKDGCPGGEYVGHFLRIFVIGPAADELWFGLGRQSRSWSGWIG